jgi:superfamily II DNA or RNA helicase
MLNTQETYLGNKGYTIYKNTISVKEQQYMREELNVRPYIPKSPVQPPAFPIYRESQNKLYVPRFFGVETYGVPNQLKIAQGENISVPFSGSLRDYQENIVNVYKKNVNDVDGGGGLLEVPCGRGKTVIALKLISELKKKTLVIVHKGFLVDQWLERIEQFLPGARVGKIQGQIIDIENKDIVIGMLQSLSMKEYPNNMFDSFGLTIVDECHHISSEVFSRSLLKIVTKYCLGLSATMQRKDGLTRVFKMFLGEIIYKEKREGDDGVLVKAIEYKTEDDEFNETVFDYRGNPAFSTMISKLCTYNRRSEFLLEVVQRELAEKSGQQIMILAHNKNLLVYLHNAIEHRNIASCGFYVGGMKKEALKETESKTIVIATYAMAAEALDIKTLTTLILATPRTDVTQAVGRILRVKHERPLVVDIVDSHNMFKNQWMKRKRFYEKSKYHIIYTDSNLYSKNKPNTQMTNNNKLTTTQNTTDIWTTIHDPLVKKTRVKKSSAKCGDVSDPLKGKCLIKI